MLDKGKGRIRGLLLDARATSYVKVHRPRRNAKFEQPGMMSAMSWRSPVIVTDGSCALARGSRSRLSSLDICLGGSRILLLQDRLASSCGFGVRKVASAHVLGSRRERRPLLLHHCSGERSHRWEWIRDHSHLMCLLDGLSALDTFRLVILIRKSCRVCEEVVDRFAPSRINFIYWARVTGRVEVEKRIEPSKVGHGG